MTAQQAYVGWLLATVSTLLGAVALFNAAVDPHGAYRDANRLDRFREGFGSPIGKAEQVRREQCDTVLLGASQTLSLNPHHPVFEGRSVCNAGLVGATFDETRAAFDYAVEVAPVKWVLVFPEFMQFNGNLTAPDDFARSRFAGTNLVDYHLERLLSRRGTLASARVVRRGLSRTPGPYTRRGFRAVSRIAGTPGVRFRASLLAGMLRHYRDYTGSEDRLEAFRGLVRACRQRKIKVRVVLPPLHATHVEAIAAMGQSARYEAWKRAMVQVMHEETRGVRAVWDLQVYNAYTTEPLPAAGGDSVWFWDSVRFRPALGAAVLDRVMGEGDPVLGDRIGPDSIEDHLSEQRRRRVDWAANHKADLRVVRALAKRVRENPDVSLP